MITDLKVLNTVTALGADLVVGTTYTTLGGSIPVPNLSIASIVSTDPVVEQKEVWTITPTAANSYTYSLVINGYSKTTGNKLSVPLSFTSDASATATEICTGFRALLASYTDLNVVASGTATLVLTASGIGSTSLSQLACFEVASTDGNISAVNGTDGIPSVGLASQLAFQYPANQQNSMSGYADISNLASGYYYKSIVVNYAVPASSGSNAYASTTNTNSIVCLVKCGTSATPTTANYATLCDTWGTVAQLAAGYKATIVAVGANVDFGSNLATRASGSFITESLVAGDVIAVSDGATTTGSATVVLPYSDGATAANFIFTKAYISSAATVSAGAAFVVHKVNLPI
jgi:hypothetical protein